MQYAISRDATRYFTARRFPSTPSTQPSRSQLNWMSLSITDQVRTISEVTTAVARGDLTRKVCLAFLLG
ncbi:hypothetical protein B0H19DRAFT_1136929 [Mycena capillaripes]|nr:hypothetical protein B0H19DRAFT_1136929 [Mycena capillaripes]